MARLGQGEAELLQALQVEVERLARVGEGFGERRAAGDNVGDVGEVHNICRVSGRVLDREDVASISVGGRHRPSASRIRAMSVGLQVLRRPWGTTTVRTTPSARWKVR